VHDDVAATDPATIGILILAIWTFSAAEQGVKG